ncbi:MAG: heme exporter protein CcmD [Pseudomonadota bacterium]
MIPDLGKYAVEVLSAYAVSLVLIAALVLRSVQRGHRIQRQLREVEQRQQQRDG